MKVVSIILVAYVSSYESKTLTTSLLNNIQFYPWQNQLFLLDMLPLFALPILVCVVLGDIVFIIVPHQLLSFYSTELPYYMFLPSIGTAPSTSLCCQHCLFPIDDVILKHLIQLKTCKVWEVTRVAIPLLISQYYSYYRYRKYILHAVQPHPSSVRCNGPMGSYYHSNAPFPPYFS